jgi:hypothetical protein
LSNGAPWLPDRHDPILKTWAGRITDKEIGAMTGHSEGTVRENRKRLELPAFHPQRVCWSRRDYLLAGAAGLMENAV